MQNNSSTNSKITHDFSPFFKVHENGHIERCIPIEKIPPFDDPNTGLRSKDVIITLNPPLSARIFMPKIPNQTTKVPILVYFHGGGYSLRSAFDPIYHNYLASLAHKACTIVVSFEYRLAPENPIPSCYDDAVFALKWVANHSKDDGEDPWLNKYGDFERLFIGGDSGGANIAYNVAIRIGGLGIEGVRLEGLILVHPHFVGVEKYDRLWLYLCPKNGGLGDWRISPREEDEGRIGFERVMICVGGRDALRDVGVSFYVKLKNSKVWKGKVELVESEGGGHVFHLFDPKGEEALLLMRHVVSFIHNVKANRRSKM